MGSALSKVQAKHLIRKICGIARIAQFLLLALLQSAYTALGHGSAAVVVESCFPSEKKARANPLAQSSLMKIL